MLNSVCNESIERDRRQQQDLADMRRRLEHVSLTVRDPQAWVEDMIARSMKGPSAPVVDTEDTEVDPLTLDEQLAAMRLRLKDKPPLFKNKQLWIQFFKCADVKSPSRETEKDRHPTMRFYGKVHPNLGFDQIPSEVMEVALRIAAFRCHHQTYTDVLPTHQALAQERWHAHLASLARDDIPSKSRSSRKAIRPTLAWLNEVLPSVPELRSRRIYLQAIPVPGSPTERKYVRANLSTVGVEPDGQLRFNSTQTRIVWEAEPFCRIFWEDLGPHLTTRTLSHPEKVWEKLESLYSEYLKMYTQALPHTLPPAEVEQYRINLYLGLMASTMKLMWERDHRTKMYRDTISHRSSTTPLVTQDPILTFPGLYAPAELNGQGQVWMLKQARRKRQEYWDAVLTYVMDNTRLALSHVPFRQL